MQTNLVSDSPDALLSLIESVKLSYNAPGDERVRCGVKPFFSELSFLLLVVVAVVIRTFSDSKLFRLLKQDAELLNASQFRRIPHRTSILRRLKQRAPSAEQQITSFGGRLFVDSGRSSETTPVVESRFV